MNSGEAFIKAVSDRTGHNFGNVKIAFDVGCVALAAGLSLLLFRPLGHTTASLLHDTLLYIIRRKKQSTRDARGGFSEKSPSRALPKSDDFTDTGRILLLLSEICGIK